MKRTLVLALWCAAAMAADVSGTWQLVMTRFGEQYIAGRAELKTAGEKLTGGFNDMTLEGAVTGDAVRLTLKRPDGQTFATLAGRVSGDVMSGTVNESGIEYTWKAERVKAAGAPRTHTFEPVNFYRHFTSAVEPVLRIQAGDTVRTWALDAGGVDAKGVRRANGGNPQTGPFYVEGAVPGDTLAVKFRRIRPNRDTAFTTAAIFPGALTPSYIRGAKLAEGMSPQWKLDREGGYATLLNATERLKNLRVKLDPMLGCVGVAPAQGAAFRSGWPGAYGGNMDYNRLVEGVTVYLPVNVPGALLFMGDGHAAQADGELNGVGLETSMDIEFTVNVIAGFNSGAPRMENAEWIMASGIANSLPEALQQATSEMLRWLERDYKLTASEAAIVVGTSVRLDIAEVVDPQVHVVARISKETLATLK